MDKYKIDYSKWDRMEDSDDDDDDDGDRTPMHPQVTVFDKPTRVTFGGDIQMNSNDHDRDNVDELSSLMPSPTGTEKSKGEIKNSTQNPISGSEMNTFHGDGLTPSTPNVEIVSKRPITTDAFGIPLSWIKNGASIQYSSYEEGMAKQRKEHSDQEDEATQEKDQPQQPTASVEHPFHETLLPYKYLWSQDRMMIHIRIPIHSHRKLKYHVHVSNMLSYPDRHCATFTTESAKQQLVVSSSSIQEDRSSNTNNDVLLEGTLTYPVYLPEDYDDDEVDWSIQHYNAAANDASIGATSTLPLEKYILITLYKATPMMGMTIWWKRCLTSETNDATIVSNNDSLQKQAFQKVWDEAHEQFQQTIQSKTKFSL